MAWDGYFTFAGQEFINSARTEAYAKGSGWFRPAYGNTDLGWMLGDGDYTNPFQDQAPWTDPDAPESYDFYGVYPLGISGLEDSTRIGTVFESINDGGTVGRLRHGTRAVVFNVALLAGSDCGAEYGARWLRRLLLGAACSVQASERCAGDDLCYLSCEPTVDWSEDWVTPTAPAPSGITDPRDIPGLRVWYSAEAETGYSDGATITQMTDQSGNNRHATSSSGGVGHTYSATGGSAGGPAYAFTTGWLQAAGVLTGLTAAEYMATVKSDQTPGLSNGVPLWAGASGAGTYWPYSDALIYDDWMRNTRYSITPGVALTSWRRVTVWSAAADYAMLIDGAQVASSGGGGVPAMSTLQIARNSLGNNFVGKIGALLVYDHKLTTTERADLSTWVAAHPSGGVPTTPVITVTDPPYLNKSLPPPECLADIQRGLRKVVFNTGPTFTSKQPTTNGGAVWTATMTAVAGNPWEYTVENPIVEGFGSASNPYVSGITGATGAVTDPVDDTACRTKTYLPVFDPSCPAFVATPDYPTIPLGCYTPPSNWLRRWFSIPKEYVPLWGEIVPKITVRAPESASLNDVRIRFYADADSDTDIAEDPCAYCGDFVVSYVPQGESLVIDGADEQVYVEAPGAEGKRRADSLVFSTDGTPFAWPVLSCGFGYVVTVDTAQNAVQPTVDLSLFSRAA